jgi:hypothetical protein
MIKPYELKDPIKIKEKLSTTTDLLGLPIDKGIFRSIVILNSIGFYTTGSCEGHPDEYSSQPYIDIVFQTEPKDNIEDCKKLFFETLFKNLEDFYKDRKVEHSRKIVFLNPIFSQFEITLRIASNLKIYKEDRAEKLREQYLELTNFCEFLNKKYNLNY